LRGTVRSGLCPCGLRPGLRAELLPEHLPSAPVCPAEGPSSLLQGKLLRDKLLRPGHLRPRGLRPGTVRSGLCPCGLRPGLRAELLPEHLPSAPVCPAEGPVGLLQGELLRGKLLRPRGLRSGLRRLQRRSRCGPCGPGDPRGPGPGPWRGGPAAPAGPGKQVIKTQARAAQALPRSEPEASL
jgi:hypothetical protein